MKAVLKLEITMIKKKILKIHLRKSQHDPLKSTKKKKSVTSTIEDSSALSN